MQLYLAVTVVVLVILEVTSRSVSAKPSDCEVDRIIKEHGLKANPLNVYGKEIFKSSYEGVFNIDGKKKKLKAGDTKLVLITNKTGVKWVTFFYSEALLQFIAGSPLKFMMYNQQGEKTEQYLGNKLISTTACKNITCEPFIRLSANSYFKRESFKQHNCNKYTLLSVTLMPSLDKPIAAFDDETKLPFKKV